MDILKRHILVGILLFCHLFLNAAVNSNFTISGYIKDGSNGEALIGAGVYVAEIKKGTTTNTYGYYSITLPEGSYQLSFTFIGYATITQRFILNKNTTANIDFKSSTQELEEVVVTADRPQDNILKAEMSTMKIDMKTIKAVPAMVGEVDPIRVIQMMPGVVTASEGSTGFNVRGGAVDQNLVLMDDATVYNPSHFLGFLSVFNNDAIKDLKLYKADIPAQYGGRLSSLLDVRMRDGNNKKFAASGGIGLISSRLTLEGPIVKDKGSFIISGRTAYVNLFLPFAKDPGIKDAGINFYDLNIKANYTFSNRDKLFISGYFGRDVFQRKGLASFDYGNKTLTIRWNHLFYDQIFCNTSLVYSNYDYALGIESKQFTFKWLADMKDLALKHDYTYYWNPNNTMRFGVQIVEHKFQPGNFQTNGVFSSLNIQKSYALEEAVYISNEQKIGSKITLDYGIRYAMMQNIGPQKVFKYDQNFNVYDSSSYSNNTIYNNYAGWEGFEPRVGANFVIDSVSSIKANYTRTRQFIHLASNAVVGLPLDMWLPSSPNIKPQLADQIGIGYFRNFFDNQFETSVEMYYKDMKNQIDFRDYAQLWLNPRIEGEFRFGKAKAYGIEFLIRKQSGNLQGWIGYTYARVTRYFADINNGTPYSTPYDKPHTINTVLIYNITPRLQASANWIYSTGTAITMPAGKFTQDNLTVGIVTTRNGFRLPDYHRMDLGITLKSKDKPGRKFFSEWNLSVYNLYYRKNPWIINLGTDPKDITKFQATQVYLFAVIPSLTWNFKF